MMPSSSANNSDDPLSHESVAEAAARWLARKDRGFTATEAREFAHWRSANPLHDTAFEQIDQVWRDCDLAKADPELAAMARQLDESTRERLHPQRNWWKWGIALAAAAAAIAFLLVPLAKLQDNTGEPGVRSATVAADTSPAAYRIIPDRARHIALADGSVVDLFDDSEVEVRFEASVRNVRMIRGEAFFTVAHDRSRPFIVTAGMAAVRAVGTAFSVRMDSKTVTVLVTEGKVNVNDGMKGHSLPLQLLPADAGTAVRDRTDEDFAAESLVSAGQRVIVHVDPADGGAVAQAKLESVGPAEMEQSLAWKSEWFVFKRTPLGEAIKAFNQRGAPKLVLGDPSLSSRLLGGTFRSDNVEGFVRLLEQSVDVQAERQPNNEIVLRPLP